MSQTESSPKSYFPQDSRENQYGQLMRESEYVEDPKMEASVLPLFNNGALVGFFCGTCEYMKNQFNSPTRYWCTERLFPDQPYGCCRYWSGSK